jgi:hypothetical protein
MIHSTPLFRFPEPALTSALASPYRSAQRELGRLLSVEAEERREVVDQLPQPYRDWSPGEVFEAVVELGFAARHPKLPYGDPMVREVARGNFECLGEGGLHLGWEIVRHGRDALVELTKQVLRCNEAITGAWHDFLGPLRRHVEHPTYLTKFRSLLMSELPDVLEGMKVPVKVVAQSQHLRRARNGTVTLREAHHTLGISRLRVRKLLGIGDCHLGGYQHVTARPLQIFERAKLEDAIANARTAITDHKIARQLGVPCFIIPVFVGEGVVRALNHQDAQILAGERLLLDPGSVRDLMKALATLDRRDDIGTMVSLSEVLRHELNPWVWSAALRGVVSAELPACRIRVGEPTIESIWVHRGACKQYCRSARERSLPEMEIPGHVASRLLGLNSVLAWDAARAGLLTSGLRGIRLPSLQTFRQLYVTPAEVSEWWVGTSREFCLAMRTKGITPVAVLRKVNIWRRSDVTQVFGESMNMRFGSS